MLHYVWICVDDNKLGGEKKSLHFNATGTVLKSFKQS